MADHPKDSIAIGLDGSLLPLTPAQVHRKLLEMTEKGEILAAVIVTDGEIGVQVFGPPSEELLHILQQAAKGYKRMLRRARGATQ